MYIYIHIYIYIYIFINIYIYIYIYIYISEVLKYHHIPDHIQVLISSLYSNFQTSIISNSFQTPFITVGRGVLQGDCLSPLTFNLCFNTFINYISAQKFSQFGFSIGSLSPIHWFQFADDAAVITGLEKENQLLPNHFSRWCTWANMKIRVDKCSTFGIKKASTSSVQYLPKLILNHDVIPTISKGESFKYLGRYFNFSMDNHSHMSEVLDLLSSLMNKIDLLHCHPKNKLLLYHRFVLSKVSWNFTIANLGKTWVVENLDNLVSSYVRRWLDLPISATLSTLALPKAKYGINFVLPSTKFSQCQTVIRNALKSSPNSEINSLWAQTSFSCNVQYDLYQNTKQVLNAVQKNNEMRITHELKSQGFIISSILTHASSRTRSLWSSVQQSTPKNIFNFSIKYLNNTLATRKNLSKWSICQSSACSFCLKTETLQHIVSSCTSYLEEGRYTWRHNSVLLHLANTFSSLTTCSLYADLPSFLSPSIITGDSLRPDLILVNGTSLYILELTVGFESNMQINSDRKKAKCRSLLTDLSPNYSTIKFINLSMSTLGLLGKSSDSLLSLLEDLKFDRPSSTHTVKKIMNIAIRCSYYIFCIRNKPWTDPALLEF